jgi:hypothetical protein
MLLTFIKRFWKEVLLVGLAIVSYLGWSRKPEVQEVIKTEYIDRVVTVEKIVTVEKTSLTNKKRRTTIQKPDGTKIVTETTEEKNTDEKVTENEKKDTKEIIKTETQITINRNTYSLNLSYSLYGDETAASSINIRLGQLPILIGPYGVINLETKKYGIGINLQVEL